MTTEARSHWLCWRNPAHKTTTSEFGWPECTECHAAPAYHERPSFIPEDYSVTLYVPKTDLRGIAPRSAIVGRRAQSDGPYYEALVYYEGWVNGPMQYGDRDARGLWEAGVLHASGRMVTRYPTTSMAQLPEPDLIEVGRYFTQHHRFEITDEEALDAWLNR